MHSILVLVNYPPHYMLCYLRNGALHVGPRLELLLTAHPFNLISSIDQGRAAEYQESIIEDIQNDTSDDIDGNGTAISVRPVSC